MLGAKPLRETADHLMIVAAFTRWFDQFRSKNEILVPATAVDIIVLEKRSCGQYDVRDVRRLRHKLLMHAHEQVFTCKSAFHQRLIRTDGYRICVLDDHRGDRRTAMQCLILAGQNCSDAGLVEHPYRPVPDVKPFDQGLVESKNVRAD